MVWNEFNFYLSWRLDKKYTSLSRDKQCSRKSVGIDVEVFLHLTAKEFHFILESRRRHVRQIKMQSSTILWIVYSGAHYGYCVILCVHFFESINNTYHTMLARACACVWRCKACDKQQITEFVSEFQVSTITIFLRSRSDWRARGEQAQINFLQC